MASVAFMPCLVEAASYKFCLRYDDERYWDASVRSGVDFGEDIGRNTGAWKVRNIYTVIIPSGGGTAVWSDWVDADGCTTEIYSTANLFNIYYLASYKSTETGVKYQVFDCPGGTNCASPYFSILNYSTPSSKTYYPILAIQNELDAFVATAVVVERFLGTNYQGANPFHDFRIEVTGSPCDGLDPPPSGVTGWDAVHGYPISYFNNCDARSKFTIAHEFGHAIEMDRIGGLYPSDVDCSYGSGSPSNHTMQSMEYQSCASAEGFGDFVSVLAWNQYPFDADGVRLQVNGSTVGDVVIWDAENGNSSSVIHTHCSGSACNGFGTEIDWLRAWWDYKTDSGTRPTNNQILQALEEAHPWPTSTGHWNDIGNGIFDALGYDQATRFLYKSIDNSIDQ